MKDIDCLAIYAVDILMPPFFSKHISYKRKACFLDSKAFRIYRASLELASKFGQNLSSILESHMQVNAVYLHGPIHAGKTTIANEIVRKFAENNCNLKCSYKGMIKTVSGRTILHADLGIMSNTSTFDSMTPMIPNPSELLIVEHPEIIPIWQLPENRIEIDIRINDDNSRDISAIGFNDGQEAIEILKEMHL